MDAHHHHAIGDNDDDVDMMHEEEEEEGQQQLHDELHDEQQQQQQQDEDENMDEQEVDGEEEAGEGEDREVNEENVTTMEELIDEAFGGSPEDGDMVERVGRNDPDLDSFTPSFYFDDIRAILLGKALFGNTALTELSVNFCNFEEFTSLGAQVLILGIGGSHIRDLALEGDYELPWEMSLLYSTSLEKIALHFPIDDEFIIQFCKSLTANKLLEQLSIQVDEMTLAGAHVLSGFLRNSSITSLTFRSRWDHALTISRRQDNAATTVTMQTLLLEGVRHCQSIRDLCLFEILGDMPALVTTLPQLHRLSIKFYHRFTTADVEVLTQGLRHAHQLHTLEVSFCRLNDQHMSILSPVLGTHPSIKSLILDHNLIGDAGIASFVEHWSPESKLEELVLSWNEIGSKGAELLIKALSNHTTLSLLNLSYNVCIGLVGLALIGKALPAVAKIQTLVFFNVFHLNPYENDACDEAILQEAKRMAAGQALVEGVRNNSHLRLLHLDRENLPANSMEEIDLYLKANALGRQAALQNQYVLPRGIWCHFLCKEGMDSSLVYLFLRELPGLFMGNSYNYMNGWKRRRL